MHTSEQGKNDQRTERERRRDNYREQIFRINAKLHSGIQTIKKGHAVSHLSTGDEKKSIPLSQRKLNALHWNRLHLTHLLGEGGHPTKQHKYINPNDPYRHLFENIRRPF